MSEILLVRPNPPIKAVGIALDLLHLQAPFANWEAKELVSTIKGAVKRNHYVFSKEDRKFTGFACWGLVSEEIGKAYVKGLHRPSFQDCENGNAFLLFIIHAQKRNHLTEIVRFMKTEYPDHKVFGRRFRKTRGNLASVTLHNT
ncbi:MAG: toxin-activating lysine-acyltransferase [Sneathiellales bacterium]|nr:toxin-activating lysine-acyltransferase [Sneathiellales bacterium]